MSLIKYLVTPLRNSKLDSILEESQRDLNLTMDVRANRRSNRQSGQLNFRDAARTLKQTRSGLDVGVPDQMNNTMLNQSPNDTANGSNGTGTSVMMGNFMMHDYVSEKMFWVNELIGNDKIKVPEYVQRVITMGQFLESKAIERLPKNPNLGRRISKEFCQFVSECVAD